MYKYYSNDLGIKQIKTNSDEIKDYIALENLVYNDLISKDYKVFVGKTKKGEIDFVATKNNKTKYSEPHTIINRMLLTSLLEFSPFNNNLLLM